MTRFKQVLCQGCSRRLYSATVMLSPSGLHTQSMAAKRFAYLNVLARSRMCLEACLHEPVAQIMRACHACTHEMLRHDACWSEMSDDFSEYYGGCIRSGGGSPTTPRLSFLLISRPAFQHSTSFRNWPDCCLISGLGNNGRGRFPGQSC